MARTTRGNGTDRQGGGNRLAVLLLAEACNPDWPSLPIVAYKYALALGDRVDATIATHIRNKPAIEAVRPGDDRFVYIDTEWIARPLYRLASRLRGGTELAWSTGMVMGLLPYLAFERQVGRRFARGMRAGAYDLIHRISPMTPTFPSPLAGAGAVPFVLGPLNGALDWPPAYAEEQKREGERARVLRPAYRFMPYATRTQRRSDLILAAFPHTISDLTRARHERVVNFPEIGFDPEIFHAVDRHAPFSGDGPKRFLFVGRLVPYKLPEAAIRALAARRDLAPHHLHIAGDGPEGPRLRALVEALGLGARVHFEGRMDQRAVAERMRACDALVFPSIRELGAGVVIEAMACGLACLVADYGAPGHLCADGRGYALPVAPLAALVESLADAMAGCLAAPEEAAARAHAGRTWAEENYTWDRKADHTISLYRSLLAGNLPARPGPYD